VHREEGEVNTNKEGSEMNLSERLIVGDTTNLLDSVVEAGEDGEYSPHREDVMEVRNHVIGIMEGDIQASVS